MVFFWSVCFYDSIIPFLMNQSCASQRDLLYSQCRLVCYSEHNRGKLESTSSYILKILKIFALTSEM